MRYFEQHGYVYPEHSDEHMITVKHLRDTHFDENYSYKDTSLWFKIKHGLLRFSLYLFVFLVVKLVHGVKIYGRKEFKKNKELLKNGGITICNHVFMWDYLVVLSAIRPIYGYFPAWATNFEGPNGPLIRNVGGIPVPTTNLRAMKKFKDVLDEELKNDRWLHFYPEGSMWFYYPDIRPLKPAVFKFAVNHNKPIIPLTISFRPKDGIYKLYKRRPCVDITIGKPIYPDETLSTKERIEKMHNDAYIVMQNMVGIKEGDPTFNTDQNISNYTMHKNLNPKK